MSRGCSQSKRRGPPQLLDPPETVKRKGGQRRSKAVKGSQRRSKAVKAAEASLCG